MSKLLGKRITDTNTDNSNIGLEDIQEFINTDIAGTLGGYTAALEDISVLAHLKGFRPNEEELWFIRDKYKQHQSAIGLESIDIHEVADLEPALESIGGRIRKFFKWIKDGLVKLYNWFRKLFGLVHTKKDHLIKMLDKINIMAKEKNVPFSEIVKVAKLDKEIFVKMGYLINPNDNKFDPIYAINKWIAAAEPITNKERAIGIYLRIHKYLSAKTVEDFQKMVKDPNKVSEIFGENDLPLGTNSKDRKQNNNNEYTYFITEWLPAPKRYIIMTPNKDHIRKSEDGPREYIQRLNGAKFAYSSETKDGKKLEAKIEGIIDPIIDVKKLEECIVKLDKVCWEAVEFSSKINENFDGLSKEASAIVKAASKDVSKNAINPETYAHYLVTGYTAYCIDPIRVLCLDLIALFKSVEKTVDTVYKAYNSLNKEDKK